MNGERQTSSNMRFGNATCRTRLEGWARMIAARSPIWGRVDLEAFCRATGYSREHATRTLSLIRRQSVDLAFETKICQRRRNGPKRWGVIVAERAKLRFDRYSLFYDTSGRWLHNYTNLGMNRQKIPPTVFLTTRHRHLFSQARWNTDDEVIILNTTNGLTERSNHSRMASERKTACRIFRETPAVTFLGRRTPCDNSPYGKGSFGTQPLSGDGAGRDVALRRPEPAIQRARDGSPLRRKAFAMLVRLAALHWDNCKVTFSRCTAFCYALEALTAGHEERRILACYERALFICHGLAVDFAARTGDIVRFNLSSTVTKARRMLMADGLTARERVSRWYRNRRARARLRGLSPGMQSAPPETCEAISPPAPLPDDPAELRRKIAESLGCDGPD